MRKVLTSTNPQPNHETARSTFAGPGCVTVQTVPAIGCHCQQSSASARLAKSTYVLRSTDLDTVRVHQRLNAGRAMTLCCTAKSPRRAPFTSNAVADSQIGRASCRERV